MRTTTLLLALAAGLLGTSIAHAGAWTQKAGGWYIRESVSFYRSDQYYDRNGDIHDGDWSNVRSEFSNTQAMHILEYGFTDEWTLVTNLVYKRIDVDRPDAISQQLSGFSDLGLGLKRRLKSGRVIVSAQATVDIPTGYDASLNQVELDQGRFYLLGSGELNVELRLLAGGAYRLLGVPGYYNFETGYKVRGGAYENDLTYAAAIGMQLLPRTWFRLGFSGVEHLGTASDMDDMGQTYNSASYTSAGVAATIKISDNVGLEIGYSGEVDGVDTLKGRAVDLAVELRL